jgi:hypothetical protein
LAQERLLAAEHECERLRDQVRHMEQVRGGTARAHAHAPTCIRATERVAAQSRSSDNASDVLAEQLSDAQARIQVLEDQLTGAGHAPWTRGRHRVGVDPVHAALGLGGGDEDANADRNGNDEDDEDDVALGSAESGSDAENGIALPPLERVHRRATPAHEALALRRLVSERSAVASKFERAWRRTAARAALSEATGACGARACAHLCAAHWRSRRQRTRCAPS